jgi:hypothetical protein
MTFSPTGEKKDRKEKREARKAKRRGAAQDANAAANRLPTIEELSAAGARLGPRAQVEFCRKLDTLCPVWDSFSVKGLNWSKLVRQ